MERHRNSFGIVSTVVVLIFIVLSAFIVQRKFHAGEAAKSERRNQIIQLYIKYEFSNGNVKLRKFDLVGTIPIFIECKGLDQSLCQHAKQTLDRSFEPSINAQLKLSASPVITFDFADSKQMGTLLPLATEEYAGGVSDVSDPECVMFYQYADPRILRGKIIASTDQAPNKLRACMIVQIGRLLGPGFSVTDKFSLQWSAALGKESDEKLDQTRHISSILEYIHMCQELKPGMLESEVLKILLMSTHCALNLEGIN
jgi:hypothetical protein